MRWDEKRTGEFLQLLTKLREICEAQ